jgi:uncharacterized repeat protein (TIGR03803 family)
MPHGGLIFDQVGNLYGTTSIGGGRDSGIVFKLTRNSYGGWTKNVLYDFGNDTVGSPAAGLTLDAAGNLYGTASGGGCGSCENAGGVFKLTPKSDGTWEESVLHRFCSLKNCPDGANPEASLIFDAAGNLYSTAWRGGNSGCGGFGCGLAFKLTPKSDGTWVENVLHRFCSLKNGTKCLDGANPGGGTLIFDALGNFYGTTSDGGDSSCNGYGYGCGVVFKLTPTAKGAWKEKVLRSFAGKDGISPWAGLIFDQSGNLYGTTVLGGDRSLCDGLGCGTVFKLSPNSKGGWNETVLHTFFDHPGANPIAGLIFDAMGNLYGTTLGRIPASRGSVFEITP